MQLSLAPADSIVCRTQNKLAFIYEKFEMTKCHMYYLQGVASHVPAM